MEKSKKMCLKNTSVLLSTSDFANKKFHGKNMNIVEWSYYKDVKRKSSPRINSRDS